MTRRKGVGLGGVVTLYQIPELLPYPTDDAGFRAEGVAEAIHRDDFIQGGCGVSIGSSCSDFVYRRKGVFAPYRKGRFWTYGDVGLEGDVKSDLVDEAYETQYEDLLPPRPPNPRAHEEKDSSYEEWLDDLPSVDEEEARAAAIQRAAEAEWRRVQVFEACFEEGAEAAAASERIARERELVAPA